LKIFNRQDAKSAKVGREEEEKGRRTEERRPGEGEKREPDRDLDELAHRVIGAAIEVHRHLGPGFLESVYEEALAIEFRIRGVPHERQKVIAIGDKTAAVGEGRLDFLVAGCLIVELKAIEEFAAIHQAQVISYLKATHLHLGLLINFNVPILKNGLKRIILS